jgi:membrane-bound serine protease (ClpP class)
LDTPGGSVEVTKSIVQNMLVAPVPIVVYVSPAGAHAGSAGAFITLAAHVAAMAPNTSIGAASPVELGGEDVGETFASKITNILSADIENLAERRGEAATEWAIAAVRDAAAATAGQALELGVIDMIATDIDHLLEQLDGRLVSLAGGAERELATAQALVVAVEMTWLQRLINFLADPSIATILLSLGILGLVVEIRTPGFGIPGILGALCLLMAFYGLGQLDANLTGLALMALALALFVAEAFTPTFGVLASGGAIAFALGAVLLFNTTGIPIPWTTIIVVAAALVALAIFVGAKALAAQRSPAITGSEGMIGSVGATKDAFAAGEPGSIFVQGEWWNAQLTDGKLAKGEHARVIGRDGFTLIITRVD